MSQAASARGAQAAGVGRSEDSRLTSAQTLDAEVGLRFLISKLQRATGTGYADHVIVAQVLDAMEPFIKAADPRARPLMEAALAAVERADDMLGEELDRHRRRTVEISLCLNSPANRYTTRGGVALRDPAETLLPC